METLERATYTVAELTALLGVGKTLIYDAVKRGEIPHVKLGDRVLFPKDRIDRWLAGE